MTQKEQWKDLDDENTSLKAEVERLDELSKKLGSQHSDISCENIMLRKAGDELERVLTNRCGSYEAGNASHEWQSAKNFKPKEGKQS